MSGYAIDSEKKCNLTNDFDFNLDIYNNYKNILIKTNFPEEIPIVTIPIKSDSVKLTEELSENMPETQIKEQNNNESGVAHFLEHMCFKGTKKYPYPNFIKIIEKNNFNVNAYTSKEHSLFSINCLNNTQNIFK